MSTLRIVNILVTDNNPNIKGEARIVYRKEEHMTEFNDADTKMNILATGEVAKALTKHNDEVRGKTVDKGILRTTGRDVMLEPIELVTDQQLDWSIVQTG